MMNQRIALVLLLLLAACGRERAPQPAAGPPDSTPRSGGRLVVALNAEPSGLDPLLFEDLAAGLTYGMMNHGLVGMDGKMEWQPRLADRWAWSADGTSLDLHLRPKLVWSDGVPFTTQDVVQSYALYANPQVKSPRASNVQPVTNVTVLDDEHVRLTFAAVGPELLRHVAVDLLPAHVTADLDPAHVADWPINRAPVVLGPYRLKSWRPGVALVLERNPYYWGEPARLDEIEIKIVPDRATQVLQVQSGELDMMVGVPGTDADRLEADDAVQVVPLVGRSIDYMVLNLHNPLFEDVRVRRALSLAIDRRALVDGILDGRGEPGAAYLVPMLWAHDDALQADAHDPEQAAQLLTQAGWVDTDGDGTRDKDGVELHFELTTTAGDPARENAAVIMRRNLEDVGVSTEILLLERGAQIQRAMQDDFDATVVELSSSTTVDPSMMVRSTGHYNFGHYANAQIDSLLDVALATPDRDEARPAWIRLQEILDRDKPFLVLYYPAQVVALRTRVHDATPNLLSPFYGIERWWVADE